MAKSQLNRQFATCPWQMPLWFFDEIRQKVVREVTADKEKPPPKERRLKVLRLYIAARKAG
ncbi:hypothetical protein, partial [Citrobacter freundii]|uniref:hypothetical protein n=1 Tax=Citrobacter freundii TaxID=546 RepID=UPI0023AEE835